MISKQIKKHISHVLVIFSFFAVLCFISCVGTSHASPDNKDVSIEPVTFYPKGGKVDYGTLIHLNCETEDSEIWYSTDRTFYPTNYSSKGKKLSQGETVELKSSVTLYAVAVDKKGNTSVRTSAEYIVSAPENTALYFGNPSAAVTDENRPENYLIERETYALSYNNTTHIANWVCWHYENSDNGNTDRNDSFYQDDLLPKNWFRVGERDYNFNTYGFDRGHMCPSFARTSSVEANKTTFYMTNVIPQSVENNQKVWAGLEKKERSLVNQSQPYELYIASGPYGKGGSSSKAGKIDYIAVDGLNDEGILVPAYTWKVILAIKNNAAENQSDLSRITLQNSFMIAVMVPNTSDCYSKSGKKEDYAWQAYLCSVDEIEEKTGYDFFSALPDEIEDVLEAAVYNK